MGPQLSHSIVAMPFSPWSFSSTSDSSDLVASSASRGLVSRSASSALDAPSSVDVSQSEKTRLGRNGLDGRAIGVAAARPNPGAVGAKGGAIDVRISSSAPPRRTNGGAGVQHRSVSCPGVWMSPTIAASERPQYQCRDRRVRPGRWSRSGPKDTPGGGLWCLPVWSWGTRRGAVTERFRARRRRSRLRSSRQPPRGTSPLTEAVPCQEQDPRWRRWRGSTTRARARACFARSRSAARRSAPGPRRRRHRPDRRPARRSPSSFREDHVAQVARSMPLRRSSSRIARSPRGRARSRDSTQARANVASSSIPSSVSRVDRLRR